MQEQEDFLPHYQDFLERCSEFSSFFEQKWIQRVFQKFEQEIHKEDTIEIGVSGGVDSMTLMGLLLARYQKKGYDIMNINIVHCNHKIRPQSEEEAKFLKSFFDGMPFFYFERICDQKEEKEKNQKQDENTLRKRRYDCFLEVAKERGSILLLTGHHLEDRIETSLLNCMRGATIKGFLNMRTIQLLGFQKEMKIFRPLLDEVKEDFYYFCQTFSLLFYEDCTNENPQTSKRNRIRKSLITPLLHENGGPTHFLQSMRAIYQEIELHEPQRSFEISPLPFFTNRGVTFAGALQESTENFTEYDLLKLREYLGIYYNITQGKIQDRLSRFHHQKGMKNLKNIYFFFHEKKLLILETTKKFWEERETRVIVDSFDGGSRYIESYGIQLKVPEKIDLQGATIRFALSSDKIHGKTRNRRCINQKIPLFRRNRIPLAIKDGNIIYIWKDIIHW